MTRNILLIIACLFVGSCLAQDRGIPLDDLIKDIFQTKEDDKAVTPNPDLIKDVFTPPPGVFQPTPTKTTVLDPHIDIEEPAQYKSCGLEKQCVKRYLCKDSAIIEDGTGLIDVRIDGAPPQNNECGYLEVCCDIPSKTTDPIITIEPQHEGCGFQNPDGVGFKISGDHDNESQFGEFPWMVAILREEEAPSEVINLYECGGALIAPTVVLTAAHCVQTRTADTLVVRAGEWDTQTKDEILPHQDRRVKEIIVHEKYNKGSLYNDIALLIMETPFVWEENVRPICLPEVNTNFDHSRCYATGWGKDKFGRDGNYQVILKKIDLPIVPRGQCQRNLRTTRLGGYFNLHESFICAGGEKNKDTCKGDGGSPLVCPIPNVKNRFYQAGIVAWGIGCGEEHIPGVYASVSHLRPWIDSKLSAKGINFQYFTP